MSPLPPPPGSESLGGQPTNSRCPGATSTQGEVELVSVNMDDVTIGGFPFSAEKSTFPPPGFKFGEMTNGDLQTAMDAAFPESKLVNEALTGMIDDLTNSTTEAFGENSAYIDDGVVPDLDSGFSQGGTTGDNLSKELEDLTDFGNVSVNGVFQAAADAMGGSVATNLSTGQFYDGTIDLQFKMEYETTFWEERISLGWEVRNNPICLLARVQGHLEWDVQVNAGDFFTALKGDLSAELAIDIPTGGIFGTDGAMSIVVGGGASVDLKGKTSAGAVAYFDVPLGN